MKNFNLGCFGIFSIVFILVVGIATVVNKIQFNQECGGYLKQAADANTVELAIDRLDKAIAYAESNGMTTGYTSILYKTENDNVGFWYENLKACRNQLEAVKSKGHFEQTNELMKLRESLTDNGENGTELTYPNGLSRYPNNMLWGIAWTIGIFLIYVLSFKFSKFLGY